MRRIRSVKGIMIVGIGSGFLRFWVSLVAFWVSVFSVVSWVSAILKSRSWNVFCWVVFLVRRFTFVPGLRSRTAVSKFNVSSSKMMVNGFCVVFSRMVNVNSLSISGG